MSTRWWFFVLAWVAPLVWAQPPVKLFYSSQTDFTEMTLTLKKAHASKPEYIDVEVRLTPEARARTKAVTLSAMHQQLTLYLNGRQLTTSTVRGVLDGPGLMLSIPRDKLLEMMPSLMN